MKSNEEVSAKASRTPDEKTTIEQEEQRLQELALIPRTKMSEDERREYNRLHNRKSRRKSNTDVGMKRLLERAERAETQEQFWQLNQAEESPKQLEDWLALQEKVLDQLHWMNHGHELPSDDPDYVSPQVGLEDLEYFIQENGGFIKDFNFNSRVLNEFEPSIIFIWANRSFKDAIWGKVEPYWKNQEVLAALIEENEPTKVWALYGIRIGVPEYHFMKWKQGLGKEAVTAGQP